MKYYMTATEFNCGIDLHAKQMYACIMVRKGRILVHQNIRGNDFGHFLKLAQPAIANKGARARIDRSRILGRCGPLSPRPGTVRSASAPWTHPERARMVVWLNAAYGMKAGARRSKRKRRLWKKPFQDPLCPCATGGLMVVRFYFWFSISRNSIKAFNRPRWRPVSIKAINARARARNPQAGTRSLTNSHSINAMPAAPDRMPRIPPLR